MILTGAGQIGMAIARSIVYGMKIVVGDRKIENANAICATMNCAGFNALQGPGTADEVANVAELLMLPQGAFITGSDFLIDGGATASYFYGPLNPNQK